MKSVRLVQDGGRDLVLIETVNGAQVAVGVSWQQQDAAQTMTVEGRQYTWSGLAAVAPVTPARPRQ